MKKLALALVFVLLVSLWGCGASGAAAVETLQGWSFQYNEGTGDYSIFFGLLDKSERFVSADVDVDVRIVNNDGTEVYRNTHHVTEADFGYYSSQVAGERFLANLRIPASAVAPGTSADGKVYFTVYSGEVLRFDEVNCDAFYCLPLLDVQVEAKGLPAEVEVKSWDGSLQSRVQIDGVSFEFDKELGTQLRITVTGVKTYGIEDSMYDLVGYKLYDSEGYVVASGDLFLDGLSEGDKFKDDSIWVFDAVPGETYTIEFCESSL